MPALVCACVCVCTCGRKWTAHWHSAPITQTQKFSICLPLCMSIFFFFFPLSSPSFFFVLKRYDTLSLFLSLRITPKLILSAKNSMIYTRKSLCSLWNCARVHLRLDLFSYSVPSGCFVFFFLTHYLPNWSILAFLSSLSILPFPLGLFFSSDVWSCTSLPSVVVSSCSSAACWREGEKKRESK